MYPDFYLQFWKTSSKVSSLTNIINSNDQNFSFHNIHANILFLFCFFLDEIYSDRKKYSLITEANLAEICLISAPISLIKRKNKISFTDVWCVVLREHNSKKCAWTV